MAKTPRKVPLNPNDLLHYIDRGNSGRGKTHGTYNESDQGGSKPGNEDDDFGVSTNRIGNTEPTSSNNEE